MGRKKFNRKKKIGGTSLESRTLQMSEEDACFKSTKSKGSGLIGDEWDDEDNFSTCSSDSEGWTIDLDAVQRVNKACDLGPRLDDTTLWTGVGGEQHSFISSVLQQAKNLTDAANATTAAGSKLGTASTSSYYSNANPSTSRQSLSSAEVNREPSRISSIDFENFLRFRGRAKNPKSEDQDTEEEGSKKTDRRRNRKKDILVSDVELDETNMAIHSWAAERIPVIESFRACLEIIADDLVRKPEEFYCSVNVPNKKKTTTPTPKGNGIKTKTSKTTKEDKPKAIPKAPEILKRKLPERTNPKPTSINSTPTNSNFCSGSGAGAVGIPNGFQFIDKDEQESMCSSVSSNLFLDCDNDRTVVEFPTNKFEFTTEVVNGEVENEDPENAEKLTEYEREVIHMLSNGIARSSLGHQHFSNSSLTNQVNFQPHIETLHPTPAGNQNSLQYDQEYQSSQNLDFEVLTSGLSGDMGFHLEAMDSGDSYGGLEFINGDVIKNDQARHIIGELSSVSKTEDTDEITMLMASEDSQNHEYEMIMQQLNVIGLQNPGSDSDTKPIPK